MHSSVPLSRLCLRCRCHRHRMVGQRRDKGGTLAGQISDRRLYRRRTARVPASVPPSDIHLSCFKERNGTAVRSCGSPLRARARTLASSMGGRTAVPICPLTPILCASDGGTPGGTRRGTLAVRSRARGRGGRPFMVFGCLVEMPPVFPARTAGERRSGLFRDLRYRSQHFVAGMFRFRPERVFGLTSQSQHFQELNGRGDRI